MNIKESLEKKMLPPTLFVICILMAIFLNFSNPIYFVKYPYNLIGIIFFISGLYLSMKGSNQFQKANTNINTFDEPDKLIIDGLFKYSRNPMYLGFIIALLGVTIILSSVESLIILFSFIIISDQWYVKFEEKVMIKKFEEEYKNYMKTTRRWI
jgi:protein-S-isoprenylcysteine O-methyltransferase Ste14